MLISFGSTHETFLTGPVSSRGHDGARLCNDRRDLPVLVWLQRRQSPRQEDHLHFQALL